MPGASRSRIDFGYPGGSVLPLFDSLYDESIPNILTRHEQGAVHAAEGYAKATGKPGVVIVTSGPGATNVVTGIADAMIDSVPLVVITGQVTTPGIGKDAFQEADMLGITVPITKIIIKFATSKSFHVSLMKPSILLQLDAKDQF